VPRDLFMEQAGPFEPESLAIKETDD
jgi:hypothetical protein